MQAADLVAVGLVGKPLGLRGEVFVMPDPDFGVPLTPGRRFLTDGHGELEVATSRDHSGRMVARFAGCDDRTAAEGLRGERLLLPRNEVELDEEGVWVEDILGLEARTADGELIGVVEGVADGLAHDYLVIARPDGGEVLIPSVEEFVELTDDAVIVKTIPGLLE